MQGRILIQTDCSSKYQFQKEEVSAPSCYLLILKIQGAGIRGDVGIDHKLTALLESSESCAHYLSRWLKIKDRVHTDAKEDDKSYLLLSILIHS